MKLWRVKGGCNGRTEDPRDVASGLGSKCFGEGVQSKEASVEKRIGYAATGKFARYKRRGCVGKLSISKDAPVKWDRLQAIDFWPSVVGPCS